MRFLATIIVFVISVFSVSSAVVPDLFIDGVALDPAQYRLNNESEDLSIKLESNVQYWNLLSDLPANTGAMPSFGLYTDVEANSGHGKNKAILFDSFMGSNTSLTTNFSDGTDVGFWLSEDMNTRARLSNYNSVLFSERDLSINDKLSDYQSFIMYDLRGVEGSEYSYGKWSGSGDYDYLIFIEDKYTDGIDHDDMVVGMMVAPEPGTLFLLASGLLGTGLALRRRKKII